MPPALVADIAGGSFPAVINILLALRQRDATGEGCHLDIAMTDAMFTFAWHALAAGFATGRFPASGRVELAGGSPRYQLYPTRDGKLVACGALEEHFWERFTAAIGLAEAFKDDRRDPAATGAAVAKIMAARTAEEWRPILAKLIAAPRSWCRWRKRRATRISSARSVSRTEFARRRAPRSRPCRCRWSHNSAAMRAKPIAGSKTISSASPRISRGWAAAGATPSRMTARRRPDPVHDIEPKPRAPCIGRKPDSRERLRRSTAKVRLATSRAAACRNAPAIPRRRCRRGTVGFGRSKLGDGRGIAQAEIKALRADRWDAMRGFADQCHPVGGEAARRLDRERENAAPGLERDFSKDRMRALLDLASERVIVERRNKSASAGSTTQTILDRWPGSGTSVKGPVSV